ncbi:DUF983 domain-containing protein [uncultured Tenacibaculum sp.]|uniref:DUF983 domain-containing protein n=1 Tax=uncultured Tenacibaculum sp. TaxID=174713 RepID=UPI00260E6BC1|nr:DUF983 domain-containing protein [uncultured Tenacibaculum sp.]
MKSLINILSNKCPHCKKGHVFKTSIFNPFSIGKMDQNCSHCGFTYEKEPGFFFGAMYVSYALIVAESVAAFVILRLLLNLNWFISFGGIVALSLFLFAVNFKLSRVIWIYIFHSEKYKKNS